MRRYVLNLLGVALLSAAAQYVEPTNLAAQCEISQAEQNLCNWSLSNNYLAAFAGCQDRGYWGFIQTNASCTYINCQLDQAVIGGFCS